MKIGLALSPVLSKNALLKKAPSTLTVDGQTFARLMQDDGTGAEIYRPHTLQQVTKFGESNWWKMEARLGDKRPQDAASPVRRVGWDGYLTKFIYGYIQEYEFDQVYSEEYLNSTWGSPMENHISPKAGDLYETSGTPKIGLENNRVRIISQTANFDAQNRWIQPINYGYLWEDITNYHRFVANRRYRWKFRQRFDSVNGTLEVWLTEFDIDGVTLLTPTQKIVNYTGNIGYGSGRLAYPQFRVYCSEDGQEPVRMWTQLRSFVQEQFIVPFVTITDTFNEIGILPAEYIMLRAPTGTQTVTMADGKITIASGTSGGTSPRFARPITNAKANGTTQYQATIIYQSAVNGQSNLTVRITRDATHNFTTLIPYSLNGGAAGTAQGLNSGAPGSTAVLLFTVPTGSAAPHLHFEGTASLNRSIAIDNIEIIEL